MNLASFAARNVLRNRFRTALTVAGVGVAVLAFVLLRTVLNAWLVGAEFAAQDRIATRDKVTFINMLPLKYAEEVRRIPGVTAATWANWFGGKVPGRDEEFFATLGVDHTTFLSVYDEVVVDPAARECWARESTGALVGKQLAARMGWKAGEKVRLESGIFPGDWTFHVCGLYDVTRKSFDASQFLFRWQYFNDGQKYVKDQIGWVIAKVPRASDAASVSKAIDQHFEARDTQTLSMSERALNTSFLSAFDAVLKAMNVVSIVILAIMALILGNTIAMGVRERTQEYGVLRALGFLPQHLAWFVLGEAVVVGLAGGVVGIVLSYPIVQEGLGRYIEENMGGMFPYFRIAPSTAVAALGLSVALGIASSVVPARAAARIRVVEALRRIG